MSLLTKLFVVLSLCDVGLQKIKHKKKKVTIEYEYLPQGYTDPTQICKKPNPPSKGTFTVMLNTLIINLIMKEMILIT